MTADSNCATWRAESPIGTCSDTNDGATKPDLHRRLTPLRQELKTEIVDTNSSGAAEVMLVRLRAREGQFHVQPSCASDDFLVIRVANAGSSGTARVRARGRGSCNFVVGGQCYRRAVLANFDTQGFEIHTVSFVGLALCSWRRLSASSVCHILG